MRVFVSHGSHDAWIAAQMARCIRDCGIEVSIDTYDLKSGDVLVATLADLVNKASELVVLFTPFSKNRPWVWMEIGAMLLNQKRIIPVFHGMARKDLAKSGGDGALAGVVDRQLNDFDVYLSESKKRAVDGH
jgi:hypothetical protein